MDYQNYEDYMRSVLGYQAGNIYANSYNPRNEYYYDMPMMQGNYSNTDTESLNKFYPEIYKLIYPMVCKICNQNMNRELTKDLIDKMTEDIYVNFETEENSTSNVRAPLKNGDVRNPNAKEPELRSDTRQRNFLLRDLIKILILREFGRPGMRPPFPPGRPHRPPMGPGNPMPPWRPY